MLSLAMFDKYSVLFFIDYILLSLIQWSYGVTCWEIFSLGRIPYPGVDNVKIISLLRNGIRLEQPYLCPSDL